MGNISNLTVKDVINRLEKQHWDEVNKYWIPSGDGVESIVYSYKVIGDYELTLSIIGVESFGCLTVRLVLSKH